MADKKSVDVADILVNLQRTVLSHKPPMNTMLEEIRMMKFKIKPLLGDISMINFKNQHLIEIMWSLGKLDDFFQREYEKLRPNQREMFYKIFEDLHGKFQAQLNALNLNKNADDNDGPVLEMEIYKDYSLRKKMN